MDWTPQRIADLRKRLGLSQSDFAAALGLSRTASVSDLENGRTNATGPTARLLDYIEQHGPTLRNGDSVVQRLRALSDEAAALARAVEDGQG